MTYNFSSHVLDELEQNTKHPSQSQPPPAVGQRPLAVGAAAKKARMFQLNGRYATNLEIETSSRIGACVYVYVYVCMCVCVCVCGCVSVCDI